MILTLRPDKDLLTQCEVFGAGVGHYGRINSVTADDTSGISSPSSTRRRDLFGFPSGVASGVIINVTTKARAWTMLVEGYISPATIQLGLMVGRGYYRKTESAITQNRLTYSESWAINPLTQSVWTWPSVYSLGMEVGLKAAQYAGAKDAFTAPSYCSQAWVEVEYEPEARRARILIF